MNGHNISAPNIYWDGFRGGGSLDRGTNPGALTASDLLVGAGGIYGGSSLKLISTDSFTNVRLNSSTLTTAATSNITGGVSLSQGSTLNFGANMNMSGSLDISANSGASTTVDAQHHDLKAGSILVVSNGSTSASLINTGNVQTNSLFYLGSPSGLTLHGGDTVNSVISLIGNSTLIVQQTGGTGLTFNGGFGDLQITSDSQMDLIFALNSNPNWDLRLLDPGGANWISTLQTLIAERDIVITAPQGYSLYDDGVYTYVEGGYGAAVAPEPSSLVIVCVASLGLGVSVVWKRWFAGR
jgi:hypothetical protein